VNGVHDHGGMHGFGPVEPEENEPVFHAPWEGHVMAMVRVARAKHVYNIDQSRWAIEQMAPADYLRASYYERWLASLETNLVEAGVLSREEIEAAVTRLRTEPELPVPIRRDPALVEKVARTAVQAADPIAVPAETRFKVGDAVVTRRTQSRTHTRLPRYARGRRGVIDRVYGLQILPDAAALGREGVEEVLYSVRFAGSELWGESAEPNEQIYLDLWESYLELAEG
jgi:nitrile hydratase